MPTQTFLNLPNDKQMKIIQACIDEFSTCPFSQASINQIIKKANISRGSFYQYFQDKEDCYMSVLNHVAHTKLSMFENIVHDLENVDIFTYLEKMLDATIEWVLKEPKLYQVGYWMDYDDSLFIKKLLEHNKASTDFFAELIKKDKEAKRIKAEVDEQLLTKILFVINKEVLMEGYKQQDFELVKKQFSQVLAILKGGVANV